MKEKDKISEVLLDAIWVTRWNEPAKLGLPIIDSIEAIQMIERIFKELDKSGYKIVKKSK